MEMFKYKIPQKVSDIFLHVDITSAVYQNREYFKNSFKIIELVNSNEMEIACQCEGIYKEDFSLFVPKDKKVEILIDELIEEIDQLSNRDHIIVLTSIYRNDIFLKKTNEEVCEINNNAQEGISNNVKSFLKNKFKDNEFKWKIIPLLYEDLESVHKFYYYNEDFIINKGTGAGTLTGWLTSDEIQNRAKNNKILTLNQNYRLTKSFYERIKGI